jgi:hypothetical protein
MSNNDIDISLANTPKPTFGGVAIIFMIICAFLPPVGWFIAGFMLWSKFFKVREWERQVQLAASMGKLDTNNGRLKINQ